MGLETIETGAIEAYSVISPLMIKARAGDLRYQDQSGDQIKGVCVTRSFYFARQFSNVIFGIDLQRVRNNFRVVPRAEVDAYDLANSHGDFRLEAEEFIICDGLSVDKYVTKIWLSEEYRNHPEYDAITKHPMFVGYFKQP